MKSPMKSQAGATLLETLLVLAVAAMVIVMSIRYYQTAQNSQNSNLVLQEIQNIIAAADSLASSGNTYTAATSAAIAAVAGSVNMTTPWGTPIKTTATSSTVAITPGAMPSGVCELVKSKVTASSKQAISGTCPSSLVVTYTPAS
jgi:type II secretory pathway pseudopilin PulG